MVQKGASYKLTSNLNEMTLRNKKKKNPVIPYKMLSRKILILFIGVKKSFFFYRTFLKHPVLNLHNTQS